MQSRTISALQISALPCHQRPCPGLQAASRSVAYNDGRPAAKDIFDVLPIHNALPAPAIGFPIACSQDNI